MRPNVASILLIAAISLLPGLSSAQEAAGDPVRGLTKFLSNLLQTHGFELQELAASGRHEEAAALWARERAFFEPRATEYKQAISSIANQFNERFDGAMAGPLSRLKLGVEAPAQWRSYGTDRTAVRQALSKYESVELLRNQELRSPLVNEARDVLHQLDRALEASAIEAFLAYDHFGSSSFLVEYPIRLPDGFFQTAFERLKPRLSSATKQQLAAFIAQHRLLLGESEREFLASLYIGDESRPVGAVLKDISQLTALGLPPPASASVRLIAVSQSAPPGDDSFVVDIKGDSQLKVSAIQASELDDTLLTGAAFIVLASVRDARIHRKIVDRGRFDSRYISGTDTRPNPAYEQARLRYLGADAQYQQQELRNSLNPAQAPLVAVLQGIASGVAAAERQRAFDEFSATSPTLSVPRYASYKVETATVSVRKEGTISIAVIEPGRNLMMQTTQPFVEERNFSLAYGIREDDENRAVLLRRHQTERDVEDFEKRSESLSVGNLIATLAKGDETTASASLELIRATFSEPAQRTTVAEAVSADASPAVDDARFASVVIVKAGSSGGAGFFVAENLVVTNDHVVEGAGFAEIKLRDGREVYGKVIKRDPDADLALIRVSADVPPLQLAGGSLKPGQTVEAIGHPRGLSYSLTRGVVSAMRKRALPGMRGVILIQTDAAINPGNSGGPLFDGGKVVGINTMKFRGAEGIGFAVHADEIARFIRP